MRAKNERPKASHKREPFFVLTVVAAVIAGLLLLDTAVPLLPREGITTLFTGGRGDNIAPGGEAVTRPLSLWEQIFGAYEPESDRLMSDDPIEGRPADTEPGIGYEPWLTEPAIEYEPWLTEPGYGWPEPMPEPDVVYPPPVEYMSQEEKKALQDQVERGLRHLSAQYAGRDRTKAGIFDFDVDGVPEITIVTYLPEHDEYGLCVYDLAGNLLYGMVLESDEPSIRLYSEQGMHPCLAIQVRKEEKILDSGQWYASEQTLYFDPDGLVRTLFGVTQVEEEYTFVVNDNTVTKDVWYEAREDFDNRYTWMEETSLVLCYWVDVFTPQDLANILTNSIQSFVRPVEGTDAYRK